MPQHWHLQDLDAFLTSIGIYDPHTGESNGQEDGKWHENWNEPVVYRGLLLGILGLVSILTGRGSMASDEGCGR